MILFLVHELPTLVELVKQPKLPSKESQLKTKELNFRGSYVVSKQGSETSMFNQSHSIKSGSIQFLWTEVDIWVGFWANWQ
jgi:hypothetical protein